MTKIPFLTAGFCLLFFDASAQGKLSDTLNIQTIEITGRGPHRYTDTVPSLSLRINVPLIETPQNITVINQDAIKDFGLNGVSDVSKISGGIVKTYGVNSDYTFLIRGFDATNNNFRNGIGGYWWNQQADVFMLEKIEIVKGPAGFLSGTSLASGFINEVTKQADGKRVREIELSYGSFNLSRVGIDIGDKFSDKSRFSYRIVVGGQYTEAEYDFYSSYRVYVAPSLRYTYKEGSNVQIEYNGMNGHFIADTRLNASYDCKNHFFPYKFNMSDKEAMSGFQTNDNFIRLSHHHKFNNRWNLNSQLAYAWGVYTGDHFFTFNINSSFDTIYREYEYYDWQNSLAAGQSYLDGKFFTGSKIEHSVLTGIEYGNSSVTVSDIGVYDFDNYGNHLPISVKNPQYNLTSQQLLSDTTGFPDDSWPMEWISWFGQDQIKFFDKLILIFGGRYSYTELSQSWDSTTVYTDQFTPRYGLMYLITKNISVYAIYDESFVPQSGNKEDGTPPKPETGTNNEFGFKAELFKRQLMINAALFKITRNNLLVNIPNTNYYEERGQATSKGMELNLTGNINANIAVLANYAYIDAKITEDPDASLVGYPMFDVPNHSGNINIRYRFLKGKISGLSLGAGAQIIGKKSAAFHIFTSTDDKDKKGIAYSLIDANIGYEIKKFRFHMNVYNLLNNQKFFEKAIWVSPTDTNDQGFYVGYVVAPINFRFTIGYSF